MKCFNNPILGISLAFILYSCANIVAPTGGEKDNDKPKLTKTIPASGSINYKETEVKFIFSEWIQENNLKEELIIIPTPEKYKTKVSRNTITFYFDSSSLVKNTTYYFNLREGIKDITEGNKSDSATLVFSTGTYIDSLEIAGSAKKALDNKPEKNTVVLVFAADDSFNLLKSRPLYQTKTEKNGDFRIQYMKPGNYYIYAFVDENNNGKYDENKEFIGYSNNNLNLKGTVSDINLKMVKEDHENMIIKRIEASKSKVPYLEFNKEISFINIKELKDTQDTVYPYINGKSLFLYTTKKVDTTSILIETMNVLGNNGRDTIKIAIDYTDTSKYLVVPNPGKSEIEPNQVITIQLSKPYKTFKPIIFIKNGNKEYTNGDYTKVIKIKEDKVTGKLVISPINSWKDSVAIKLYPETFETISGNIRDTIKLNYTLKSVEKYGSIGGKVNCDAQKILIQLLGKDSKIIKQTEHKDFLFEYLQEGEYNIRVVDDQNGNSLWDQGDYRTRKMPEIIYHYPDTLKLKANWEILDVKISF